MASRAGARSVKDATRFTSTIPHATSKAAQASPAASNPAWQAAKAKAASRVPGETPEQRVRRLRQAHLAAQKAQISQADRAIDTSRKVLNVVHRWTVTGVVIFTVVAGIVSIYSVWDMLRYNRARRAEWVAAQRTLEDNALAAARLAYMQGKATEEQILLVEEANREAEAQGSKLPPLMEPPQTRTHFEEKIQPALQGGDEGKGLFGIIGGLFGGGKTGAEDSSKRAKSAVEVVEDKVGETLSQELENQRTGGSLDQLGLEPAVQPSPATKKGWWPW